MEEEEEGGGGVSLDWLILKHTDSHRCVPDSCTLWQQCLNGSTAVTLKQFTYWFVAIMLCLCVCVHACARCIWLSGHDGMHTITITQPCRHNHIILSLFCDLRITLPEPPRLLHMLWLKLDLIELTALSPSTLVRQRDGAGGRDGNRHNIFQKRLFRWNRMKVPWNKRHTTS